MSVILQGLNGDAISQGYCSEEQGKDILACAAKIAKKFRTFVEEEELVSSAVVHAVKQFPRFDMKSGPWWNWLEVIMQREMVKTIRRERYRHHERIPPTMPHKTDNTEDDYFWLKGLRTILTDKELDAIILVTGLDGNEPASDGYAAQQLATTRATIQTRRRRAIKRLREPIFAYAAGNVTIRDHLLEPLAKD